MVALWVVAGLVIATLSVSILAAAFSVSGLSDLFSGATLAVIAMASSLEFAKFVLVAYLHQTWSVLNLIFKTYLLSAIVVLSIVTSMGIFGFLSNAYETTSSTLEGETIKMAALKNELARVNEDIARINRSIDEIPISRITKKMKARAEVEPIIAQLQSKITQLSNSITTADLHILEVRKKVGPLIYIARAFKLDIDTVVKYLILVFVTVFDPLAICLVLATSHSMDLRRRAKFAIPVPVPMPATVLASQPLTDASLASATAPSPPPSPKTTPDPSLESSTNADVIQMRFTDDTDDKDAV
jgi:hypothetical protein